MPNREILENFEKFEGLDLKSTDLTRSPTAFKSCSNTRFGKGGSLRKRPGYQALGQTGGFIATHTYDYSSPLDGSTQEELLALNSFLWRLNTTYFTISSGTNLNYKVESGTSYRMTVYSGTTPYEFNNLEYISLGTGYESDIGGGNPTVVNIYDLIVLINSNATLACSFPAGLKYAKVNGTQTGVTSITVDSGHNYVVGDWIDFFDYGTNQLVARKVSAITATSITFSSVIWDTVNVYDNQVLGPGAVSAATIPIYNQRSVPGSATSVNVPFSYWELVPFTTYQNVVVNGEPFRGAWQSQTSEGVPLPCFVNTNNVCYIYTRSNLAGGDNIHEGYPFKYDGNSVFREGLPEQKYFEPDDGAAGALTGTYYYKFQWIQHDNQGNIIQGKLSDGLQAAAVSAQSVDLDFAHINVSESITSRYATVNGGQTGVNTITVTAGHTLKLNDYVTFINTNTNALTIRKVTGATNTSITIDGATVDVTNGLLILVAQSGFNTNSARANGAQTGVTTITVYNTNQYPNTIEPGDTIYFYDSLRSQYTTRLIDTKTATTIGWSTGDAVNIAANSNITANLRAAIYRTKAGGNVYYLVEEVVYDPFNLITSYVDNKADSLLITRLIEPEIGFEPDLPKKFSVATIHQGVRVASGVIDEPNIVGIYSFENIESVPLFSGFNYFDIPSNVEGPITALASDSDSSLAVFKPNAYYSVNGEISLGGIGITSETEGDYGISSQTSVKKIKGAIFGVGLLGVMVVKNRQILEEVGSLINPVLENNTALDMRKAVAVNNYSDKGYLLYIPDLDESKLSGSLGSYKSFFFDYDQNIWFDDAYSVSSEPSGGMTMYENFPIILSSQTYFRTSGAVNERPGQVFRGLRVDSSLTDISYLYVDQINAISRSMRFIYTLGTPSIDKDWLRIKLFSMYNPGEESDFVSSSVTVTTYKNFQQSTADSQFSLSFSASTQFEADKKLKNNKARALQVVISDSTINSCFHLTGWEILVGMPYREEDIKR